MTTKKYIIELDDLSKYKGYKLCYLDTIPHTYSDWDERSKLIMETPEYKEFITKRNNLITLIIQRQGYVTAGDYNYANRACDPLSKFNIELKEYDTEDRLSGFTHYLYFTSNINEQWGDDWDDAPYEHNAEIPYDDKTEILQVPIIVPEESLNITVRFPSSSHLNSPYSVDLINAGAIPWLFVCFHDRKKRIQIGNSISVMGGDTIKNVIGKIVKLNKLMTDYDEERRD